MQAELTQPIRIGLQSTRSVEEMQTFLSDAHLSCFSEWKPTTTSYNSRQQDGCNNERS